MNRTISGALLFFLLISGNTYSQVTGLPEGFKRVLPRGAISALTNPTYVRADQARIRKDSWVLGIVLDGQAIAYSLNLLNRHEVVNEVIGETAFAAVW